MTVTNTAPNAAIDVASQMRDAMVDRLKERLMQDPRIEAAFRAVPRHLFLPGVPLEKVYSGDVVPTRFDEKNRPISSSSEVAIMAVMIAQLELLDGHRVLEIGAGTGYNAAIIADLVGPSGDVTTVDIDPTISHEARTRLDSAGYQRVRVLTGDGWSGAPDGAPYDRIILTASSADISPAWVDQLAADGILLLPLWMRNGWQVLIALRRSGHTLRSVSVRAGGFMTLQGTGAPASDPGVHRESWRVAGSDPSDTGGIFELLATEPEATLGPAHDPTRVYERMTALAASDLLSLMGAHPGFAFGLYDAQGPGLAVVTFVHVAYLGPRIQYLTYGAAPLARLRELVESGPTGCDEIEVIAEPLTAPMLDGAIERRHYRPTIRRRQI